MLLGHSMGCKVIHYFSLWVVNNPPATSPVAGSGRAWLHKFLHALLPVGGPFLGARKSFRAILSGDDMGLGTFLNLKEYFTLSRRLSGGVFLLPEGPLKRSSTFDPIYVKQEGVLLLEVVDLKITSRSFKETTKLSLTVEHEKQTKSFKRDKNKCETTIGKVDPATATGVTRYSMHSFFQFTTNTRVVGDQFPDIFTITLKQGKDEVLGTFTTTLNEFYADATAGSRAAAATEPAGFDYLALTREMAQSINCINRDKNLQHYNDVFVGGEAVEWLRRWLSKHHGHAQAPHSQSAGGDPAVEIFQQLLNANLCSQAEDGLPQPLNSFCFYRFDAEKLDGNYKEKFSSASTTVERVVQLKTTNGKPSIFNITLKGVFEPVTKPNKKSHHRKPRVEEDYDSKPMLQMLSRHGAEDSVKWREEFYLHDPNYLLSGAMLKAPPCKRVFHVYGVNLDTEWSYVYKSKDAMEIKRRGVASLGLELDSDAHLIDKNFKIEKGIIFETPKSPQVSQSVGEDAVRRSGDGTVPYQSLRYSKSWNSNKCLSQVTPSHPNTPTHLL